MDKNPMICNPENPNQYPIECHITQLEGDIDGLHNITRRHIYYGTKEEIDMYLNRFPCEPRYMKYQNMPCHRWLFLHRFQAQLCLQLHCPNDIIPIICDYYGRDLPLNEFAMDEDRWNLFERSIANQILECNRKKRKVR
jgi:hypothetical protein